MVLTQLTQLFNFSSCKELSQKKKNTVVITKNHLASSIRTAEDARNILPYAIEDEQFFLTL
jgi:hypothetical protein